MAHQVLSDQPAIRVTRTNTPNGNSVYTATSPGGLKAFHEYDPAISRDANVLAACARLAGNAPMRGALAMPDVWIFVHLHK